MAKLKVSKNFISFRQYIRTKDLSVNEQYLLELLFEFHNHNFGYAYPDLKTLMKAFNTTSKNRVVSTIKKLEKKGLIRVIRKFKDNNRYFIENINQFITSEKKKTSPNKIHVDSNSNSTLDRQIDIEEALKQNESESEKVNLVLEKFKGIVLSKKHKAVINETEKEVLENAIESINVDKVNGNYLLGAIERIKTKAIEFVSGNYTSNNSKRFNSINAKSFNNFKAREYDYEKLERQLLGWYNDEPEDVIEEELPLGISWLGA